MRGIARFQISKNQPANCQKETHQSDLGSIFDSIAVRRKLWETIARVCKVI